MAGKKLNDDGEFPYVVTGEGEIQSEGDERKFLMLADGTEKLTWGICPPPTLKLSIHSNCGDAWHEATRLCPSSGSVLW